jgi:hypothetical protein
MKDIKINEDQYEKSFKYINDELELVVNEETPQSS